MAKKKLMYKKSVYTDFGIFLARAIEITREKILTYNFLVDLAIQKKTFNNFLKVQINILKRVGWKTFLAIAILAGAGGYFYYGSISAVLTSNPLLAFSLLSISGGAALLIYKNRQFMAASKNVGERYKIEFDFICIKYVEPEDRADEIEVLMNKCVESLISELFRISLVEANKKYRIGKTSQEVTGEVSRTKVWNKLLDIVKRLFNRIKSILVKDIDKVDHSYQSFDNIGKYLSGWSLVLEKTTIFLENDKQELVDNLYWGNVNKDIKSIFTRSFLFFKAAITDIDEIQKEIRKEVQSHHISLLKRLGNTSREISVEWDRVLKIIYKAKKNRDPNFLILEKMCTRSKELAVGTMDLWSIANRLEDYVGRKDPLNQSATNGPINNLIINGPVENSNVSAGNENSISNEVVKTPKDIASKTKRKPKSKDMVSKTKRKSKPKDIASKTKRKPK